MEIITAKRFSKNTTEFFLFESCYSNFDFNRDLNIYIQNNLLIKYWCRILRRLMISKTNLTMGKDTEGYKKKSFILLNHLSLPRKISADAQNSSGYIQELKSISRFSAVEKTWRFSIFGITGRHWSCGSTGIYHIAQNTMILYYIL